MDRSRARAGRWEADAKPSDARILALISLVLAVLFGLFVAGAMENGAGFLIGAGLGWLSGLAIAARQRIQKLERSQHELLLELRTFRLEVSRHNPAQVGAPADPVVPHPPGSYAARAEAEPAPTRFETAAPTQIPSASASPSAPPPEAWTQTAPPTPPAPPSPTQSAPPSPTPPAPSFSPDALDLFFARLSSLLFGGNTIVRAGVLVLLVGVTLLLRWAAEHSVFPIELRLAAAALLSIALVAFGFRQREARPGFGQSLQGAGVAALYLVVFFAYRSYQLLPAGLAFALLAAIALSSGLLAVLQNALALIVIGQIGGFMAPVLASSGQGSHVALFSYYLLLNLLVFAVSWFRPWRALNLIGFAFTFGVGSTWGALRYEPALFASTEPFLIAFFLLYSAIPVSYALRGREHGRGWVDASLVFGTPLAVLILQYALVQDMPFGMAYSALALAAYYVLLSRALFRYAREALAPLIESLLAVGIGFATLAVPYGFDNHDLTGATWALEGAGLYWVGARQQRWLSRAAGAALQLLAAGAFIVQRVAEGPADGDWPLANARFLASLFLCLGALFVARVAHARRAQLSAFEALGLQSLIALGLCFLWIGLFHELDRHMPVAFRPGSALAGVAASVLALGLVGERLDWLPARFPGAILIALLVPIWLSWEAGLEVHPLGRAGALAVPICFALCFVYVRSFTAGSDPRARGHARFGARGARIVHTASLWFAATFVALEALHLVRDFAGLPGAWPIAALGGALALVLSLTLVGSRAGRFPFALDPGAYALIGAGGLVAALTLFTLSVATEQPGDAAPLPFVPLLNPLDLAQLWVLAAIVHWLRSLPRYGSTARDVQRIGVPALCALAFLALNAALARSVHQLAQVPFDADALWDSTPMQVTLSATWSLLGLGGTVLGSKRGLRALWITSAVLLGVVVLKLFTVDLAQLSTLAKIGTFLGVGFLLVLVGYFAPVPPPRQGAPQENA